MNRTINAYFTIAASHRTASTINSQTHERRKNTAPMTWSRSGQSIAIAYGQKSAILRPPGPRNEVEFSRNSMGECWYTAESQSSTANISRAESRVLFDAGDNPLLAGSGSNDRSRSCTNHFRFSVNWIAVAEWRKPSSFVNQFRFSGRST